MIFKHNLYLMDKKYLPPINSIILKELDRLDLHSINKNTIVIIDNKLRNLKRPLYNIYWKNLQNEIEINDKYIYIPVLISEIYTILIGMFNMEEYKCLKEIFDIDFIIQQVKYKVFDINKFISNIGEFLKIHCAPIRDKSINDMIEEEDYIKKIESLLQILEIMKIDIVNYRIKKLFT